MRQMSARIRASKAKLASQQGLKADGSPGDGEEEEDESDGDRELDPLLDPLVAAKQKEEQEKKRKRPLSPSEIFAMINCDGDESLDMAEFTELFTLLKLDLTETQTDQLFAFCDTDGTGKITEKEFNEGWKKVRGCSGLKYT